MNEFPHDLERPLFRTPLPSAVVEGIANISRQQLPLEKTLPLLLSDLPGGRSGRKWKAILSRLEKGEPLSSVIGQEGRCPELAALIEGGIESGRLSEVLEQSLADERRLRDLDRRFRGMMIYSLAITSLAILVVTRMMAGFLSMYEILLLEMLEEFGIADDGAYSTIRSVHDVIALQYWIVRHQWSLALSPFATVGLLWGLSRIIPLGGIVRYIPCLGPALYWREYAGCARFLARFLDANLSYPRSLELTARLARGLSAKLSCLALSKRLTEGMPMAEAVTCAASMPDSLTETLVQLTDQKRLCPMLRSLGDLYEHRCREAVEWFLLIWEPCLMAFVMGLLGTLVVYLFPLWQALRALS